MAFSQYTLIGAGLALVIVAALVAGLVVAGGPGEARKQKEDSLREGALMETAAALVCLQQAGRDIPEDSAALKTEWESLMAGEAIDGKCYQGAVRDDPITDTPFPLEREDGKVVRICADFSTGRKFPDRYAQPGHAMYGLEEAPLLPGLRDARPAQGRHCFRINYDDTRG